MQEAILSAVVGILGALIGGFATYKAVDKQIKEEKLLKEQEKKESERVTIRIILRFLWYEICKNMEMLNYDCKGWVWLRLKVDDVPFEHGYRISLVFDEYQAIKYDLLKYDHTMIIDVLEIYDLLWIINKHKDIQKFSQDEFDRLKKLPDLFENLKTITRNKGERV